MEGVSGVDPVDTIEHFYREHAPAVYGFLVSLCRDRVWAEDLMQETFVKATRSLSGYRGGNQRSWLFAIARTVFLDDVRKRRPAPIAVIAETAVDDPDLGEVDAIERALATLPDRQRLALVLCDQVGLSYGEVAEAVGCTPAAVKVLIHRARTNFRAAYVGDER
jgi:RNA polymerase sigma-70 factor, ECF subfamily